MQIGARCLNAWLAMGGPHVTFLSLYRPNFCSHCGCKIVRLKWRLWTSRTFCNGCTPKFRKDRCCQKLLLVLVIFGLGNVVGRALKPMPPPLVIQRLATPAPGTAISQTSTPQQPLADEDIFTCGARTKKGTPCSRRVHGPVRCWQHKGLPAMLSLDKLRIKE